MTRTPLELAALATAAIPGLSAVSVTGSPDYSRDFDSCVVVDAESNRWRVRSPRHDEAAFRLETELQVLSGFTPAIRARLPFRAPSVAGAVQIDGLRTFVYHNMPGSAVDLEVLTTPSEHIPSDIGRVIAGVHHLPMAVVESANLPVYTAEEFRSRRLNELDQAALTGRIPALLLRRWENALEEKSLWDFTPRVVHGDLHEDNLLVDRGRVVGVTGWTDLHVGDPAEDFAWLASVGQPDFVDAVVESYRTHLEDTVDENLMRRAALAAEFAIAQWLVRGMSTQDQDIIAEAEHMLEELRKDVSTSGGQDLGYTEPQIPAPPEVAPTSEKLADATPSDPVEQETSSEQETSNVETADAADAADAGSADDKSDDDAVLTDHTLSDPPVTEDTAPISLDRLQQLREEQAETVEPENHSRD